MTSYVECYKQDGFGRFPKGTKYPIIRETKTTWRVMFGNFEGTVYKESGRMMHHHGNDAAEFCLHVSTPEPVSVTVTEKRGRGRPVTGKALSPAEKQARYRARKAQDTVTVTINRDDLETLKLALMTLEMKGDPDPESLERISKAVYGSQWATTIHAMESTKRMKARHEQGC